MLDLHAQWRGLEGTGEWRFTPPTHVLLALAAALDELDAEGGVPARRARCEANRDALVGAMRRLGFQQLLADAHQAPVIVTFLTPRDTRFDFAAFYEALRLKGYVIYPGKLTQRPSFRIGCIGHIREQDLRGFGEAARSALSAMGVESGAP